MGEIPMDPEDFTCEKIHETCQALADNITIRAQLTERDREIERLRAGLADATKKGADLAIRHANDAVEIDQLRASLQAAIQRAEKAEANLEAQQQITRNTAKAANEARGDHFDAESALAAARKALEEVWMQECRCIGICACDMELAPKMRSIARAALNGDSPDGADTNRYHPEPPKEDSHGTV